MGGHVLTLVRRPGAYDPSVSLTTARSQYAPQVHRDTFPHYRPKFSLARPPPGKSTIPGPGTYRLPSAGRSERRSATGAAFRSQTKRGADSTAEGPCLPPPGAGLARTDRPAPFRPRRKHLFPRDGGEAALLPPQPGGAMGIVENVESSAFTEWVVESGEQWGRNPQLGSRANARTSGRRVPRRCSPPRESTC